MMNPKVDKHIYWELTEIISLLMTLKCYFHEDSPEVALLLLDINKIDPTKNEEEDHAKG